jgi:D-inositol-3-phosphate glycosyltransferase
VEHIVASTAWEKDNLIRFHKINPNKITVIPCGVDHKRFNPHPFPENEMKNNRMIFVGRFVPEKGMDVLLKAMEILVSKKGLKCELKVVGGGDSNKLNRFNGLKDYMNSKLFENKITFTGSIPHIHLNRLYRRCRLSIVPSYYESFGMVALESMACGVPVVASRVGGLGELVDDGKSGYLFDRPDPYELAERVCILLKDEDLRENMARRALEKSLNFSWKNTAKQTITLFEKLIRENN